MALLVPKPDGKPIIDRGSPWARGLVMDFELWEKGGPAQDLVSGRRFLQGAASGVGPLRVTTPHGPAARFSKATRDYFDCPALLPSFSGKTYTGEYLVSFDSYDTNGCILLGVTTNFYHQIATDTQAFISGTAINFSSIPFTDGAYRVLHFASDASATELFVDGVSIATAAAPSATLGAGNNFNLGRYPGADGWDTDGRLVYARLFNYKFTAAQAKARATWAQYAHLMPMRQRRSSEQAAAPGGFQAAWARGANVVLKPGLAA